MAEVKAFLRTVLRSGLLNREELQESLRWVPVASRANPEAIANFLVKAGRLSPFQARKLLQGKSIGLVVGPYHITAPLGKGGTSRVYLARDYHRQIQVALKILPPRKARAEKRYLARFLREMEMCQRVAHANIARVFEVGVSRGIYYIAMEYIPGKSLFRLVQDHGPLPLSRAARLFAEAAAGLEHAHIRGLIHRDLKPSNIWITAGDHVKILDLGLAILQGELPSEPTVVGGQGYVVGTMDYLAPEQAQDALRVDPRSDIYGLGCTLYFALTTRPPFPGGDTIQKIERHRIEEPTPITQLNPCVPEEFWRVVKKMMAKQPAMRYDSAVEVRQALLQWIPDQLNEKSSIPT